MCGTPKSDLHVTLTDPFVSYDHFEDIERKMKHKRNRSTLWVKPETELVNGIDPMKLLTKEVLFIVADEMMCRRFLIDNFG